MGKLTKFFKEKKQSVLLFIGFIVGFFGYLTFFNSLKIFAFLIPLFIYCSVVKSKNNYFSMTLFVCLLFIYFLLLGSFISFDTSSYFNFDGIMSITVNIINVSVIIFFIGVPTFMFVGIIYSFVTGDITEATKVLVRLLIGVMIVVIGATIFRIFDVPDFGISGYVLDFYVVIVNFLISLPIMLYNGIDGLMWSASLGGIDLPDLPMSGFNLNFDMYWTEFSSMGYTNIVFGIHDSLPLIMSFVCLITAVFFYKKEWGELIILRITSLEFKEKPKRGKGRKYLPNMDFSLIITQIVIIIAAFGIFLMYNKAYNVEGSVITGIWGSEGFFAVYLFMIFIPLIMLNFTGIGYYKKGSMIDTVKGTIFGLMGLYIIVQLMNSGTTYSAFDMERQGNTLDWLYVLNTFIFVAPAETLMFCVFIPAVVAGVIASYSSKVTTERVQLDRRERVVYLQGKIEMTEELIKIYETFDRSQYAASYRTNLNDYKQEQIQLENSLIEGMNITDDTVFGRWTSMLAFILFGMIIPCFVFASFHFWASPVNDFFVFWMCGLGIIYFVGGCWFTFISVRYGWKAGTICHAIHNSFTVILVILMVGV